MKKMITINALRKRVKAHGKRYYRYIRRCEDWRYMAGCGYTLAVVDDYYRNETVYIDATDEQIERICDKCDTYFSRWCF